MAERKYAEEACAREFAVSEDMTPVYSFCQWSGGAVTVARSDDGMNEFNRRLELI
jgi:uncharacterized FAD-dependent dehydrogenase